jgi:hypothetical protein
VKDKTLPLPRSRTYHVITIDTSESAWSFFVMSAVSPLIYTDRHCVYLSTLRIAPLESHGFWWMFSRKIQIIVGIRSTLSRSSVRSHVCSDSDDCRCLLSIPFVICSPLHHTNNVCLSTVRVSHLYLLRSRFQGCARHAEVNQHVFKIWYSYSVQAYFLFRVHQSGSCRCLPARVWNPVHHSLQVGNQSTNTINNRRT